MRIIINEIADISEPEVIVNCRQADEQVLKMLALLRAFDKKLTGIKDGKTYIIEPREALYFDTVDKKTFIYTEREVYETDLRLYELEERLDDNFFRSSKSGIINIAKIKSILPDLGGRLEVTLINGERLPVSRQYARVLREKLGLK